MAFKHFKHLNVPESWERYWTKYPQGMTILESLFEWVSQVDSMVDNQNSLNDNVTQFRNEIDAFVERFDAQLQAEVTETLTDWQTSGFLEVVVSSALQWQLTDYIATNEQDKQNIDAKLNGIVYSANEHSGVDPSGLTDSTSGVNTIILDLCLKTNGHKKIVFNGTYKIIGTVLIPSDVEIDLNGSVLEGNGYATNIMFSSGVFDGTTVKPYNDPGFTDSIERASVHGGTIKNCGKAFNLTKMNRGCTFYNIYFINCEQAVKATRCYYSSFKNLQYRSFNWVVMDESVNPAFDFRTENNVMEIANVSVSNRKIGMQVYDISSGVLINSCAFESCTVGFKELGNEIRNLELQNCYFEMCETGADLTVNNTVSNSFFNGCDVAINTSSGGTFESNNIFRDCVVNIKNTSAPNAGAETIKLPNTIAYNAIPNIELDAKIQTGAFGTVLRKSTQTQSANPRQRNVQNTGTKNVINTFKYVGKNGHIDGRVPFATHSKTAGTTFDIIIDTNITYEPYSIIGYHFKVTDNDDSIYLYGTLFGTKIDKRDSTAKTLTLSNNDGMLQIKIGPFNHPTEYYALEGIVRHL